MTLKQAASAIGQVQDNILDRIARLPSTNFRIAITLALAVGTGARYVASDTWVPSLDWLGFLVAMSGLDVAQYHSKRTTEFKPEQPTDGASP